VAVALGSNLGPREAHLQHAVVRLRSVLNQLQVSAFLETAPEGVPDDQPPFLNGAVVGWSGDEPRFLLDALQAIELERGRKRPFPGAARSLDLDLILVGDLVVSAPPLVLPHPRFRERRFVLSPLAEIAPDLVDPVTGQTVRELLDKLARNPTPPV
jgi:2-amino-4-hydroxy-6-hydroxymethyldihydropteridine diphosphokinase